MKLLVYVDAENISLQKIKDKVTELKEEAADRGLGFHGKFYGNKEVVKSVMSTCYKLGLEFVETSSLTEHKKNVADGKLIVDCLYDVLAVYDDKVAKVAILSRDNDFISLVYKLIGMGVEVDSPLLEESEERKSLETISADLRQAGYNPIKSKEVLGPQFPVVRQALGEAYSDDLIVQFLVTRFAKLKLALEARWPELDWSDFNSNGRNLEVDWLLQFVKEKGELTPDFALQLTNLYTRKVLGVTLKPEVLRAKLLQQSEIFRGLSCQLSHL